MSQYLAVKRNQGFMCHVQLTIKLCLDSNEWQVQAINQAVLEADVASSDDFVDNNEVMAWLETWGTDSDSNTPI